MAMGPQRRVRLPRVSATWARLIGILPLLLGVFLAGACSPRADLAPRPRAAIQVQATATRTAAPASTPGPAPTRTPTPFLPVTNTPTATPEAVNVHEEFAAIRAAAVHTAEALRLASISLPDLRTLPPEDLRLLADWSTGRLYVRFSNSILNGGPGPLELIGRPDPAEGVIRVSQRIYNLQGLIVEEQRFGEFIFHEFHNHWHLEDFAIYEVWSLDDKGELEAAVGAGNKVSYCVTDVSRAASDLSLEAPTRRVYTHCWGELQGLSPNWVDIYTSNLYGQWVEITGLPDGIYALVATVDPEGLIREQIEDNNAGIVYFELASNRLTLTDEPQPVFPGGSK